MKLEISVHALKLKNVAGAFKGTSDPFAILTQVATTPGAQPKVLGKTEIIKNNLNPVSNTVNSTILFFNFKLSLFVRARSTGSKFSTSTTSSVHL